MSRTVDFLKYIYLCYSGIRDKNRREQMMKLGTSDCLTIEHHGELYPDRLIYMIKIEAEYSGWFSIMNKIISALIVAKNYGIIPVIDMGTNQLYCEPSMEAEGIPLFEYYFKQPSGIHLKEVRECCNVTYATYVQCLFFHRMFGNYDMYLQDSVGVREMASAIAKFIRLNVETEAYINKNIQAVLSGERILGVHARGTDFKAGFNKHAIYVTTDEYIEHVQYAVKRYGYDQIFLATDEEQIVESFRTAFGSSVAFHDVYRAKEDTNIGIHCSKCDREMHHYKLGLEVLLDMYSLTVCDALVACPSGVSFHAMLNKRAKGEKYEYMDIIDKGRYKSRQTSNIEIEKIHLRRGN